jgi:hypothetical protein
LIGSRTIGGVRASSELAIIGEPSPVTMPPIRLPDPVLDDHVSPERASARTAGRVAPVNISAGGQIRRSSE